MTTRCGIEMNSQPLSDASKFSMRRIGLESYSRGAPRSRVSTLTLAGQRTVIAVAAGTTDAPAAAAGRDGDVLGAAVAAAAGSLSGESTPTSGWTFQAAVRLVTASSSS